MAANSVIDICDYKNIYDHFYIQYSAKKLELDMVILNMSDNFERLLCCINENDYVFSEKGYAYPVTQIWLIYNTLKMILQNDDIDKIYDCCRVLNDKMVICNHELYKLSELIDEILKIISKIKRLRGRYVYK